MSRDIELNSAGLPSRWNKNILPGWGVIAVNNSHQGKYGLSIPNPDDLPEVENLKLLDDPDYVSSLRIKSEFAFFRDKKEVFPFGIGGIIGHMNLFQHATLGA